MSRVGAFFVFVALGSFAAGDSSISFVDRTREAGLVDPLAGLMGHGGAWGDADGDGRPDIYVGGFCDRPNAEYAPAAGPVKNRLFRNAGNGKFEPINQPAVELFGRTSGALFADLDNDGDLDLYVANNAQSKTRKTDEPQRTAQLALSRLFRNDGGTFVDVSAASGACPPTLYKARNVGVLDFDGDGLLDLLVVEDRFTPKPRTTLFRNKGKLTFEDANKAAGLGDDVYGLGLAVADLNDDGRPDFFVPLSNRFFVSSPGGKYVEPPHLRELLAWKPLDNEDWPCGAAFGDLNRDGKLDLVLAIHGMTARNRVYLNTGVKDGSPHFRDVTEQAGLTTPVPVRCPHVEIQDFDNDGWPDIYLSAAWKDADGKITPLIYRSAGLSDAGAARADAVPRFSSPRPIKGPMVYFPAAPSADYDRDGRLDLFVINWFAGNHCRLLQNASPPRSWLQVRAVGRAGPAGGKATNRMGIGTKIWLYPAGKLGRADALLGCQEIAVGYGYASGQEAIAHFGLGDCDKVDVRARFPTGRSVELRDQVVNKSLTIEEPGQ
ncbi:MAG: FG-GAP repeat protein [Planctomycetes bacterium ADurb.Bin126]|nr:MAG: FG-GAP repeat protein [Planctomycetes bacterium ADurb.Bin126]HOD79773.1 CRTAC1 family protein [Phycisphaerae bacterium]HQL76471.1 CRTAC1 family protein [Phycisphaerae bacterium]